MCIALSGSGHKEVQHYYFSLFGGEPCRRTVRGVRCRTVITRRFYDSVVEGAHYTVRVRVHSSEWVAACVKCKLSHGEVSSEWAACT